MNETPSSSPPTACPAVYAGIGHVMRNLDAVTKDRQASETAGSFRYRGIDDVYNALHSVLADANLFLLPSYGDPIRSERQTSRGGTMFYVTVKATIRIVSSTDGSFVEAVTIGEAFDSGDKASSKAMSMALKAAMLQVFVIPTIDEKDAEATPAANMLPKNAPPVSELAVKIRDLAKRLTLDRDTYATFCREVLGKASPANDADRRKLIVAMTDRLNEDVVIEPDGPEFGA